MYLISTNSSTPWREPSRPMPDSLTPPNGRELGRDRAGVDAHHAVFERLRHAPDPRRGRGRRNRRRGRTGCRWPGAIASASSLKRKTGATGPNVSSRAIQHRGVDARQHRRLEEGAAERVRACRRSRPWRPSSSRVRDMLLDLLDRRLVDQRPLCDAGLGSVADLELGDRGGELGDEGVVDAVLRVDAVGADAGLAHVAELRHDRRPRPPRRRRRRRRR